MRRFWILDFGFWIRCIQHRFLNRISRAAIDRRGLFVGRIRRQTRPIQNPKSKTQNVALLAFLLVLAGCLPSSCSRTESQAITPVDSLSRQMAAQITPDTLRLVRRMAGPPDRAMAYPRTVLFGPDGRLFAADAERNSVYTFDPAGAFLDEITWDGAAIPYLAGLRGDTLLVFSPEARRLDFILHGSPVRHLATPGDLPEGPLQYATATDEAVYLKVTAKNFAGYLARLDAEGRITARVALPGSEWRHAGLLRTWGDSLLSLSGFFPIVDVLTPDLAAPLDSMALLGFDSPMLRRTFAFRQGDARQAPLLSSSAAPAGDGLFVLNMRPGWLRIDVYDRAGHLQRVLVEDEPAYDKQFYPIDLAVRQTETGGYEIAVALVEPVPEIRVYRWEG